MIISGTVLHFCEMPPVLVPYQTYSIPDYTSCIGNKLKQYEPNKPQITKKGSIR